MMAGDAQDLEVQLSCDPNINSGFRICIRAHSPFQCRAVMIAISSAAVSCHVCGALPHLAAFKLPPTAILVVFHCWPRRSGLCLMKIKHCFYFILLVMVIGSVSLALSFSPSVRTSMKSFAKETTVLTPVLPSTGRSSTREPNVEPSLFAASSSESAAGLAAKLTQCMSEMKGLQAKASAQDDSKDDFLLQDLRAQLQEAQIKLKAAEEEMQRMQQQQQPQEGGAKTGSQCLILERERSLCKSELRSTHAKVFRF